MKYGSEGDKGWDASSPDAQWSGLSGTLGGASQMVASAPERGVRSGVMSAQVSTASDNNHTLAGLLARAAVVLDTDRHAAKSCIQRVAALLEST